MVSTVAEDTGRERETEPSSSMKSRLWPDREGVGGEGQHDGGVVPLEAGDGSGRPANGEGGGLKDAIGCVCAYARG